MKKYYPKKINFTLAAFAVCFMLLVLAPSTSSIGGSPMMGEFATTLGETTTTVYYVANGNGTYAILAYFPPDTFDNEEAGRQRVSATITLPFGSGVNVIPCNNANLIIYKNKSALLQCAYTGS